MIEREKEKEKEKESKRKSEVPHVGYFEILQLSAKNLDGINLTISHNLSHDLYIMSVQAEITVNLKQ